MRRVRRATVGLLDHVPAYFSVPRSRTAVQGSIMYGTAAATVGVGGEMDHAPPSSASSHLTPSLPRGDGTDSSSLEKMRASASPKCSTTAALRQAGGQTVVAGGGGGGDGLDGREDRESDDMSNSV